MGRKSKRTSSIEEAHLFSGMSQVSPNAAGVDIGAIEIVVCVAGDANTQIVKAFGNYYYPDALSGHRGLAKHWEMAERAQRSNGCHGKHGRVLDTVV